MTKFIRCIEGHVYDADQSDACPVCGAIPGDEQSGRIPVEPQEDKEPKASAKDRAKAILSKAKPKGSKSSSLFGVPRLWVVGAVALLLLVVAAVFGMNQGDDPQTVAQTETENAEPTNDSEEPVGNQEGAEPEEEDADGQKDTETGLAKPADGDERELAPDTPSESQSDPADGKSSENDLSDVKPDVPETKVDDEVTSLRERAIKHFENRDFDSAIADFTDVIRQGQPKWEDYNMRGMSYHSKGQHDLAMADYERALRVPDHSSPVHYNRMLILRDRGDSKNAIAELDAAINDHNSTESFHFMERANLYAAVSEFDKAIADYDTTMDLFAKNKATPDADKAVVLYLRGEAKRRKANFRLQECNKIDPKEKKKNNQDALCGYKTELLIPLLDFEASAAINPNSAETQHKIGWIAMEIDNFDRAIEAYTKAIQLKPTYSAAYADRCVVYGIKRQWDLALGDCSDAIRHDSKNYYAWASRGAVYRMKGGRANRKKGIEDIRQALKLNPNYGYAAELLRQIGVKP